MLVKDFITKEIPVLKSFDTGEYALALMDDFKVNHLPLLADDLFSLQALVSEKELLSAPELSLSLAELNLTEAYSVRDDTHLLEALPVMVCRELSILPVISVQQEYLGVLTRESLLAALTELCQANAAGSLVMLDLLPVDYSLVDIARLVESNHAHILSLLSQTDARNGHLLITLKLDVEDASSVIRSFERFNYTVSGYFMKNGVINDVFRQRVNEFIHYINI